MAEAMRVKISRSDLLGQSVFVLVHFYRAVPDQGRKTLQSKVRELAQEAADAAIQYLLKQGGLIQVIMLEDIVKRIKAGHIALK